MDASLQIQGEDAQIVVFNDGVEPVHRISGEGQIPFLLFNADFEAADGRNIDHKLFIDQVTGTSSQ